MNLSLVICTKDRGDRLDPCLDALTRMEKPEGFELVLVNNASSDNTETVLRDYASAADFDVTVVNEPVAGLARARNTGWQASSGEIVAFTDDDCYVREDFAAAVQAHFDTAKYAYFSGRIELFDPTDHPITVLLDDDPREFEPRLFLRTGWVQGANFGMTREALEAVGGFNELLGAGTDYPAEDIEIVGRLSGMGRRGMYSPKIVVAHHHGRKKGPAVKKLAKQYNAGRGAYYAIMLQQDGMTWRTIGAFLRTNITRHPNAVLHEVYCGVRYWLHQRKAKRSAEG